MSRFVRYMVVLGLLLLVCAPGRAQHDGQQAKKILDQTAETFRRSGGVSAGFMLNHYSNKVIDGKSAGSIQLQGDKFVLTAGGITTWFDGRTQWSYVAANGEVNVTTLRRRNCSSSILTPSFSFTARGMTSAWGLCRPLQESRCGMFFWLQMLRKKSFLVSGCILRRTGISRFLSGWNGRVNRLAVGQK